jgi:hypothetical protein
MVLGIERSLPIDDLSIPGDLALVRVADSIEGTIAYAVELAGEPLGLLVQYTYELPKRWWAFARLARDARLSSVAGSPFRIPQDAMDAIDAALMMRAAARVPA